MSLNFCEFGSKHRTTEMKLAPLIATTLILGLVLPGIINARGKSKPPKPPKKQPTFCKRSDGERYEVGQEYLDTSTCILYTCAKGQAKRPPRWEKKKMPLPCSGEESITTTSSKPTGKIQWSDMLPNIWSDDECSTLKKLKQPTSTACQEQCDFQDGCTAINYNLVRKMCELKGCHQPVPKPQTHKGLDWKGWYKLNNVELLEKKLTTLENNIQNIMATLETKCDSTTCANNRESTTDIETCLGDISSPNCPSSPSGKTGLALALAGSSACFTSQTPQGIIQWSDMQANIWDHRQCVTLYGLYQKTSTACQEQCDFQDGCTAINYNLVRKMCELKGCHQPVPKPQTHKGLDWKGWYKLNNVDMGTINGATNTSGAISSVPKTVEVNNEAYAKNHCCRNMTYKGSTYQLYSTFLKPDDVKTYGCLDSCIFEDGNMPGQLICISSEGPECTTPSYDFTYYSQQAVENRENFLRILSLKTTEYGNLPETNLRKKLEYIQQDILNAQSESNPQSVERPHPLLLSKQQKYYYSKIPRLDEHCLPTEVNNYVKNLEHIFEQHIEDSQQSLINSFTPLKEKLKNMQGNYHQASHFLIQNTRMVSKLTKPEDKGGNNGIPKFWNAVLNHTGHELQVETRVIGCLSGAVGGALESTAMGCVSGPLGCAKGALTGGVAGLAACVPDIVQNACFSATSLVETTSGVKKMSELVIGDFVRTSSPFKGFRTHFTEFLGWLDRQMSAYTEMIQISTSQGDSTLTLTPSHIVFSRNDFKYAEELQPGDFLHHWNGSHVVEQEVTEIKKTYAFGSLTPLTREGTLLVDGYLASNYASFPHQISDLAMIPVKAMPKYLLENEESQYKDGVRSVVKIIKKAGELFGLRKNKIDANEFPSSSTERATNFWQFITKTEF